MVTILAFCICKCGTRLKVVAEADFIPTSGTTIASCPKCGEPQPINADKIISVTEDISKVKPATLTCERKESLLAARNKAFDIYKRGTMELGEAVGRLAHADFVFLANRVRDARKSFLEIAQHLKEHTAKHGC